MGIKRDNDRLSLPFPGTVEGLSYKFNKEYWNYAKLISGVLRHGMPIHQIIGLIGTMEFDNENINTWKNGVERRFFRWSPPSAA